MPSSAAITLQPYTLERCHAFWRGYSADPAMWAEPYVYDKQRVNAYYRSKAGQKDRVYFAVCLGDTTIGEIQLKRIHPAEKHATLSVHLADDCYKNRGYGTQAIRLMLHYGFTTLNLNTIYADAIHRNTRSQHVLETLGFIFTHEDEALRYYALQRSSAAVSD